MVQSKRPLKRLLALLLALVMTLALLPTAVLANNPDIGEGSGSAGDNYEGSGVNDNWKPYGYGKTFVRFTIVGFPEGVQNWSNAVYYGSIDTSSQYSGTDAAKVAMWWDTNAVSGKNSGDWQSYYKMAGMLSGYYSNDNKGQFIPFSQVVNTGASLPILFGDNASGTNQFLSIFLDGAGSYTPTFDQLINKINPALTADDFVHGRDNGEKSGKSTVDYRLIVEPGVFTLIDGNVAAMTWRDMAAYSLNNPGSTGKSVQYTWHTNSQNICYGLHLTRDEFVTGTGEDQKTAGTPMFRKVSETPQFGENAPKHFKDFRTDCMDTGYALSIINPGDMGGSATYESYVGRINLYIPTNGQTVANPRDDIQVGSEVYTYVGQRAGLLGDIVDYNWKNPYDPSSSRGQSVDENSAQAQSEYEAARSPKNSVAAGLYGSMEGTIRNELFNSSLSAKNFDSAMSAVNTDGIVDHNVVKAAPALKEGLEWGYVGEAVFNLNMYRQ